LLEPNCVFFVEDSAILKEKGMIEGLRSFLDKGFKGISVYVFNETADIEKMNEELRIENISVEQAYKLFKENKKK